MKEVMTTPEVAIILRIHPYTVTSLIRSGRLKAFKVSNRYRIRDVDLQAFMEEGVVPEESEKT